jgi:hypothetical protein
MQRQTWRTCSSDVLITACTADVLITTCTADGLITACTAEGLNAVLHTPFVLFF